VKRVLVTGASGFIGRPAVARLCALGHEVHATARQGAPLQMPPAAGACNAGARAPVWHAVNLLETAATDALFAEVRPSHWLHLAWVTESPAYWTSPANLDWLGASLHALKAFQRHGGARVVTAGSCAEYDWSAGWCLEDTTACRPATLYGATKNALCGLQQAMVRQHGMSQAWGRVFNLYGPDEAPSRFVPSVIQALLAGEPANCTAGLQRRDLLHVDDVASALVTMLESAHEGAFNIASAAPVELASVARTIASVIGRSDLLRLGALPSRPNDPPLLCGDNRVLTSLGWVPAWSLERGLSNTVDWWRGRTA